MTFEKLGIAMTNYRALLCVVLLAGLPQALAKEAPRPYILGIDSVRIAVSDMDAARRFYSDATGFDLECRRCETSPPPGVVILPSGQIIWLVSERPASRSSLLTEVTFAVDNLEALKQVFDANKIVSKEELAPRRVVSIAMQDPEGHAVRFTARRTQERLAKAMSSTENDAPLPKRLIHAGWVVSDREAMDKFYQDVLGFHVYFTAG